MPRLDLTMDQRWTLTEMHREGWSHAAIARRLGRHRASVGRELRRNREARGGYHAESAQRRAEQRRVGGHGPGKLEDPGSALGRAVRRGPGERWSPQQISNWHMAHELEQQESRSAGIESGRAGGIPGAGVHWPWRQLRLIGMWQAWAAWML